MVICLERGADLHMAQLMPLPLTVSCFSKIHIGFTFLVLAHLGSPGQRAVKRVCVCVCGCVFVFNVLHWKACRDGFQELAGGRPDAQLAWRSLGGDTGTLKVKVKKVNGV